MSEVKVHSNGYVLKSEVLLVIQNHIRTIQMNDYGSDEGIPQLYAVIEQINKMPICGAKKNVKS